MTDGEINRVLTPLRLIIAAMAIGVITFGGIAIFLVHGGAVETDSQLVPVLLPVLGVIGIGAIVAYLGFSRIMRARLRHASEDASSDEIDTGRCAGAFNTLTIAGGALAEGASFFGIVAYLLTGNGLTLIVPGLGLLAMAVLFPSRERFQRFVADITQRRA